MVLKKRVTKLELASALSDRTGISVNKANLFLDELINRVKYELTINGNSVKLFGICNIYRMDGVNKRKVSTGYLSNLIGEEGLVSRQEALMLEAEMSDIISDLLKNGFRVVVTGLVSFEAKDGKVKCASSSSLRGSDCLIPCRVALDSLFRTMVKKGYVL